MNTKTTYTRMDARTIRDALSKDTVGTNLDQEELRAEIKVLCDNARYRVAFNSCGGLPGPPPPDRKGK